MITRESLNHPTMSSGEKTRKRIAVAVVAAFASIATLALVFQPKTELFSSPTELRVEYPAQGNPFAEPDPRDDPVLRADPRLYLPGPVISWDPAIPFPPVDRARGEMVGPTPVPVDAAVTGQQLPG